MSAQKYSSMGSSIVLRAPVRLLASNHCNSDIDAVRVSPPNHAVTTLVAEIVTFQGQFPPLKSYQQEVTCTIWHLVPGRFFPPDGLSIGARSQGATSRSPKYKHDLRRIFVEGWQKNAKLTLRDRQLLFWFLIQQCQNGYVHDENFATSVIQSRGIGGASTENGVVSTALAARGVCYFSSPRRHAPGPSPRYMSRLRPRDLPDDHIGSSLLATVANFEPTDAKQNQYAYNRNARGKLLTEEVIVPYFHNF